MKRLFGYNWKRSTATKRVKIALIDRNEESRRYYANMHTLEWTISQLDGQFEITIDVDGICEAITRQAAHNSTGKAIAYGGLIRAKLVSSKVLSQEVKQVPIPAGYSLLEERGSTEAKA